MKPGAVPSVEFAVMPRKLPYLLHLGALVSAVVALSSWHLARNLGAVIWSVLIWNAVWILVQRMASAAARGSQNWLILRLLPWFALRVAILCGLLVFAWYPSLNPASDQWGYDPQRYYRAAVLYSESPDLAAQAETFNATGPIVFYGIPFRLMGEVPTYPLLVNSLMSFAAALLLFLTVSKLDPQNKRGTWKIGLFLFIPELAWADVMTAKDSMLVFSVIAVLSGAVLGRGRASRMRYHLLILLGILGIVLSRPQLLIPVLLILTLLASRGKSLDGQRQSGMRFAVVLAILFLAVGYGPTLVDRFGGYEFSFSESLSSVAVTSTEDERLYAKEGETSLGRRFLPSSIVEVVAFAPARGAIYLIAPLRHVPTSSGLMKGTWQAWDQAFAFLSSVIYVLVLPRIVRSVRLGLSRRHLFVPLLFSFLVLWISISSGPAIISSRYRIPAVPLLWATAVVGSRSHLRSAPQVFSDESEQFPIPRPSRRSLGQVASYLPRRRVFGTRRDRMRSRHW